MPQSARYTRRSTRKPCSVRAMVELGGSCSLARIVSFSRDGVGVATDVHSLPRRYDNIRLRFTGEQGEIVVRGDVRWSHPSRGMDSTFGVEFNATDARYLGFYDALPDQSA